MAKKSRACVLNRARLWPRIAELAHTSVTLGELSRSLLVSRQKLQKAVEEGVEQSLFALEIRRPGAMRVRALCNREEAEAAERALEARIRPPKTVRMTIPRKICLAIRELGPLTTHQIDAIIEKRNPRITGILLTGLAKDRIVARNGLVLRDTGPRVQSWTIGERGNELLAGLEAAAEDVASWKRLADEAHVTVASVERRNARMLVLREMHERRTLSTAEIMRLAAGKASPHAVRQTLARLIEEGVIERSSHGLYSIAGATPEERLRHPIARIILGMAGRFGTQDVERRAVAELGREADQHLYWDIRNQLHQLTAKNLIRRVEFGRYERADRPLENRPPERKAETVRQLVLRKLEEAPTVTVAELKAALPDGIGTVHLLSALSGLRKQGLVESASRGVYRRPNSTVLPDASHPIAGVLLGMDGPFRLADAARRIACSMAIEGDAHAIARRHARRLLLEGKLRRKGHLYEAVKPSSKTSAAPVPGDSEADAPEA